MARGNASSVFKAMDLFFTLVGPIMVIGAVVLMTMVVYIFLRNIYPMLIADSPIAALFHTLAALYIAPNLFFHYYMVVFTNPGEPPEQDPESLQLDSDGKPTNWSRFCQKCQKPKPPRSHHCQICKRCVLRMDHHCPWIGGCVGYYNHKYFVSFMSFLGIGCAYVGIFTWDLAIIRPMDLPMGFWDGRGGVVLSFILSVSVFLSVTMMTAWHMFLISTNQTTIEFYMNRYYAREAKKNNEMFFNQYDLGKKRNFLQVFGQKWWRILLPIPSTLDGDGMSFPSRLGIVEGSYSDEDGRNDNNGVDVSIENEDENVSERSNQGQGRIRVVLDRDGNPLGKGRSIPGVGSGSGASIGI